MKKKAAEIKCYSGQKNQAERLWKDAIAIVAVAPSSESGLDFEEKVFLLFTILGIGINDQTLNCAFQSALSGEGLDWLLDRIDYLSGKSA